MIRHHTRRLAALVLALALAALLAATAAPALARKAPGTTCPASLTAVHVRLRRECARRASTKRPCASPARSA